MTQKLSTFRSSSVPGIRVALWLGVLVLLISSASQLVSIHSADAQQNALLSLQGDGEAASTFVYIDKYDCPPGSDWSQATYDQLSPGCPLNQAAVNIGVNGEVQSIAGGGQWGPYDGITSFDISEEERQGYSAPHVFCSSFVPDQTQPSLEYLGATSFFNWQIQPGESIYCQFFNYQAGGQFGTVIFHKLACPDNWDLQDPNAASIEELGQLCTFPLQGVQFDYEQNGSTVAQLTSDQNGDAFWDQAPAGETLFRENLPPGYAFAVVHCAYHPPDQGNFVGQNQPMQMQDERSFGWNLEAGYILECYWFNFPADQIQLYKFWCPEGLPAQNGQTVNDYTGLCGEQPTEGTTWTLTDTAASQQIAQLSPSGGPPAYAGYHQLEQDREVNILETPPSGYGAPIVFCFENQRGNPDEQPYSAYDPTTGLNWTPQVGLFLVCVFFNIPVDDEAGGENSITVYKWDCEPGTEYGRELEYYQGGLPDQDTGPCESEHLDVPFNLIDGNGPHPANTQANGTEWDGVVLANGSFLIGEEIPQGYGEPMVFCGTLDEDVQQMVATSNGGAAITPASEPFTYQCNWYNIPVTEDTTENSVTVYKWDCDPGTESGRELEYYQGGLPDQDTGPCESEHLDIPFSLWDGNGEHPTTTQANGTEWDGVVLDINGSFQIVEQIPDGYGDPMVFCGTLDDETQQPTQATGGQIAIAPTAEPFTYQCNWYNIPVREETENSVTVYKWDCEPGTEWGRELEYYQGGLPDQDTGPCESEHLDIPLSMWDGNGEHPTTTQANGTEWDGVVLDINSSFQIVEQIPEGYGDPMVFCGTLDDETQQAYEATGGQVALFPAAEPFTYQCNWYNIPTGDEDYNYVDFFKYECFETPPEGADKQWFEDNCDPVEGWEFDLQWTDGGSTETTDASGSASWSGVPIGVWQGTESLPEGYGEPIVWCRYVEWPDEADVNGDWFLTEVTPDGVGSSFEFEGIRIECHWYNFPPEDYNYVVFYKYLCEADTSRDFDKTYYEENCSPVPDWEFSVTWDGGGSTQTTGEDGQAVWSGVPVGSWQGTETVPEGYGEPYIWCRYVEWPDEATVDGEWLGQDATGGVHQDEFAFEGMRIECHWYNFGDETTITEEPGTNWITVYKYLCGPETVVDGLVTMQEQCTESHSGVPFSLQGENGAGEMEQSTVGGVAEWTELHAGNYTITETLPPGYGEPLVYCGYLVLTANGDTYPAYTVTEGAIQVALEGENARLVCYWFNFPGDETTVTVYKYNCDYRPEGFQTLGGWQEACPTEGNDWTFTLTDSTDTPSEMVTAGGQANWSDVPEGEFTLAETLTPGWGEPVIWCGWTVYFDGAVIDAFPQIQTTTSGVYTGEITYPGTTYFCFWFNIPHEDKLITIYKYNCPEGQLEGVVPNPLTTYTEMCTSPLNGVEFTLENEDGESSATTLDGMVSWSDVPDGPFTITETPPPGYGPPIWFCFELGGETMVSIEGFSTMLLGETTLTGEMTADIVRYVCYVFNFPDPDRTVEVYKWLCPEGYIGEEYGDWSTNCTMPHDGVKFTLTDENGSWPLNTVGGHAIWYGVAQGEVTLDEQIPPGYFEPVIYCSLEAENGAAFAEEFTLYPSTNGAITRELDYSEYHWVCHVFNIPKGPGEITIYKWLCPPGYDFYGWGADPKVDCDQLWDGVDFTLDQPVGPNLHATTGDSLPGGVYFGDLDPGTYIATESVPPDVDYVFVLDCTGSDIDKVHPYPLQWGNSLAIELAWGDSIVCNWYNVPYADNGWVTVYKYQCWTATFTSHVDCEIYEHGASFELFGLPGNTSYGVGTTNVGGLYTWNDLPEGAYELDEISHHPCKVTTTKTDGQGHIWVDAGQGTIVKVYNCKPKTPPPPGTPTVPGKPPGKYPNTGTGAGTSSDDASPFQATPEGTPASLEDEYYLISCLEPTAVATPEGDEAAEEEEPTTPTPTPEVEEFDLPVEEAEELATPEDGTPVSEEECVRGALPERVVVDAAQVDAGVETLEIIDGVMEQPTGPELVTWYKETGRLGETNNVVIAGHLNYWGVPQAVFFYLDQLREGDKVEVTGDDGNVYVFEVQWVRQESNLEAPAADVIGPTDVPSLTLITCGGEWNASISEYDERTVARAVQIEVRPPDDSSG